MKKSILAVVVFSVISYGANAASVVTDARTGAMGGVGVASAHYGSAATINPALMAKFDKSDDVSIVIPSIGVSVSDKDDLIGDFDDVKDAYDQFKTGSNVSGDSQTLANQLEKMDDKNVTAAVGVNGVVTVPTEILTFGVFANGYVNGLVGTDISQSDIDYLNNVSTGGATFDPNYTLSSQAVGVAALVKEFGVAFAHKFDFDGTPVYLGLAPKVQQVDVYNYSATVNDYNRSDVTDDKYKESKSGANVDLGLAVDLGAFTYGVSARDIISRDIQTKEVAGQSYTYQIAPVVTIGAAYRGEVFTVATDIDATKTKGWDGRKESQYAGIGAEVNLWKWVQLRAGYRADISGDDANVFTAGLGLSPWDVFHVDLAAQAGEDKTYGAQVAMRYTF